MIAAIVLAAGASRRLGRPKQLVEIDGRTLVERSVVACAEAGCSPVILTLGHRADDVRRAVEPQVVIAVSVPDWGEGMAASVRSGIAALPESCAAVVFAVCDQPALSSEVIRRLVAAWDGTPTGRVACAYAGVLGVPALFGRAWFAELGSLRGDRGARGLLARARAEVRSIAWSEGALDLDERATDGGVPDTAL